MRKHLNTFNVCGALRDVWAMCRVRNYMTMHEMRNENIILLFGLLAGRKQARAFAESRIYYFSLFFRFENSPISEDNSAIWPDQTEDTEDCVLL